MLEGHESQIFQECLNRKMLQPWFAGSQIIDELHFDYARRTTSYVLSTAK